MPSSAFKTCARSEEHTSELQSHDNLVCRLLLEKKIQQLLVPRLFTHLAQHRPCTDLRHAWRRMGRERACPPLGREAVPRHHRTPFFFFNKPPPPNFPLLPLHAPFPT